MGSRHVYNGRAARPWLWESFLLIAMWPALAILPCDLLFFSFFLASLLCLPVLVLASLSVSESSGCGVAICALIGLDMEQAARLPSF